MRICYFNYEWDLGASTGAETQIRETTAGLERLGHQVLVVDRHRKPAHRNGSRGCRPIHRWGWEAANHLRSLRGVPVEIEILRRHKPEAALTLHGLRFSSVVAARRLGIPVVLQVNAPVPEEIRRFHPEMLLLPGVSDWIERRMMAAADGIVVVSTLLRDCLLRWGLPAERLTVAPNGADPELFRPEAADPDLRERFRGKILVGFIGSFAHFHGLEFLEQAVTALDPRIHFVLVGGGASADQLRDRSRTNGLGGRATFLGRQPYDRIPALAAAMDVLLAPYAAQENFYFSPLKLFEYMSSGRAVLAARLGQITEVIDHRENGMLYDPASSEDFLCKLGELARNPALRARLGANARRTIQQRYTWDHNARLVASALEKAEFTSSVPPPSSAP